MIGAEGHGWESGWLVAAVPPVDLVVLLFQLLGFLKYIQIGSLMR